MFYVLWGAGEYRLDDQSLPLRAGDLVAAPAGKEAHQIVNTSTEELRFLAFSTIGEVDVVEYPVPGRWPRRPASKARTSRPPPTRRWAGDACGLFRERGKDAVRAASFGSGGAAAPNDGSVSSRSLEQAQLCQRSHAIVQADLLGDLAFPDAQHRSARKVHLPASCGRQ
jgi:hypothetical protein